MAEAVKLKNKANSGFATVSEELAQKLIASGLWEKVAARKTAAKAGADS